MCGIKFLRKRKALILLIVGVFFLSGCGQRDNLSTETVDAGFSVSEDTGEDEEETSMNFTQTEESAEAYETNRPSEDLPKPLEVPVNTGAEDILYRGGDDIDLLRAMRRCGSDGENIYLVYGEKDLYVMPIGADQHSRVNIDNPEGLDVCNIDVDIYGRLHLLMSRGGEEWFIWRLDESHQVDKVMDISAYFETKQIPGWFLIDKDGTYYLQWSINRDGIILDREGALKHRFTPQSLGVLWIYQAAVGKDGRIYIVHGYMDQELEIGELDVESCSIKKEDSSLCFSGDETFSAMSGGTDTNLLLFSPYSGVWAVDHEKGVLENRVPLSDIDFGGETEFWPLAFLADGRLLLLGKTGSDNRLKYIPAGK